MIDPICAPATPLFPCAVAIIRVSGQSLSRTLQPLLELPPARVASLRRLRWKAFCEQALVLYFPAPASYTGEDLVEFQLHGNPLLVRRFLEALGELGVRLAEPGEFTQRALLNGKQSLLEVEALRDMIAAATDTQLRMAQARVGAVPGWILETKQRLAPWVARAEAWVDYGEDENIDFEFSNLEFDIKELLETFHVEQARSAAARWLRDGIRVALVGRPNSGKSTLFNAMAGEDRAIVTEIPGTTRDVLEIRTEWSGLPLYLFDTAGLRDATDPVERLGVARVAAVLEAVDLILHLVPAMDEGPDPEILKRLAPFQGKVMEVRSFGDRCHLGQKDIVISASKGELEALAAVLRERFLGSHGPDACLGAMATQRQRELLDELVNQAHLVLGLRAAAAPELVASTLQGLWGLLGRLTGEDRAESALDQVFRGFCLGK